MLGSVGAVKWFFLTALFMCGVCRASADKNDQIDGTFREFKNGRPTGRYLALEIQIYDQRGLAGHVGQQTIFGTQDSKVVKLEGPKLIASGADLNSKFIRQVRWTPGHRLLCHYYPMGDNPMWLSAVKDIRTKKWVFQIEGVFRDGPNDAGEKWEFRSIPVLPIDKSTSFIFSSGDGAK